MPATHEPDPRFASGLQWQLERELRRNKTSSVREASNRRLKLAGLVLGSVALGAATMAASQQIQESWRGKLLESRLEVQLQLALQRLDQQRKAIGPARERVQKGLQTDSDLAYFELKIAEAEADATVLQLKLQEIRRSGREPLDEASSPLVDGRDFVSERIEARMVAARRRLDVVRRNHERAQQLVERGLANEWEWRPQNLLILEAEVQLDVLATQLDIRRDFLDAEISAVEAELRFLEAETQNRVVVLDRKRQYLREELERWESVGGGGAFHAAAGVDLHAKLAEIEAEIRLAQDEQRIVRDELERRATEH